MKDRMLSTCAFMLLLCGAVISSQGARAQDSPQNTVTFSITDEPGRWFKSSAGPIAGNFSLAVAKPGVTVTFQNISPTNHTATNLAFPSNSPLNSNGPHPFDSGVIKPGAQNSVMLSTPGLYVVFCEIHPYMFGAVIVNDLTNGVLDLGDFTTLNTGITVPTNSDLALRLLRAFFIGNNPANWKNYASTLPWHITYPNVNVQVTGGVVVNLADTLSSQFGNDVPLSPLINPSTPAVGEVWVDTEFELTAGKTKAGTATAVDGST